MRNNFWSSARFPVGALAALALFAGGYAAGQRKFGQPKSVLHVTIIKWNPGVPETEKQRAIQGVIEMAAQIPGIKNVWVKADRIQPRDFNAAFAIEFRDRDAADTYAESPVHKAWEDHYVPLRAVSITEQVTNP